MTLFLEYGATIMGTPNISLHPVLQPLPSYGRGRDNGDGHYSSLLHGEHLTDVVLTGQNGTIDGQGQVWWEAHKANTLAFTRGHLVEFMYSTQLVIENITLTNSPFWTVCDRRIYGAMRT
jgi:polygalacturonase